ncbi:MAG: hypothetical protein HXX18_04300 [Bacteroidetes bacterium]|nr:hypothetical protein [Bacteroidota bacterium]
MKAKDWLILVTFYILTLAPFIAGHFDWGIKNYFMLAFFAGFLPIYTTHSTSIGLRFRNKYFSALWILMIGLNGLLYNDIVPIWVSMIVSFLFYNLLRLLFKSINKEDPIPVFVGPGCGLNFNKIQNRIENKRDGLFTIISFICGLIISGFVLLLTKK